MLIGGTLLGVVACTFNPNIIEKRPGDSFEFQSSLIYIVSSGTRWSSEAEFILPLLSNASKNIKDS